MFNTRILQVICLLLFLSACGSDGGGGNGGNNFAGDFTSAGVEAGDGPKQLVFFWTFDGEADAFRLEINPDGESGFSAVDVNADGEADEDDLIGGDDTGVNLPLPLFRTDFADAVFRIVALDDEGDELDSTGNLSIMDIAVEGLIGYFKASDNFEEAGFGNSIALSDDGDTLAVGAPAAATETIASGAVYVFARNANGNWTRQARLTGLSEDITDEFGVAVALSADGDTLAVGARGEDGVIGAAYVFRRGGTTWARQARVTAANADIGDFFGNSIALSDDGDTLAVGAPGDDSSFRAVGLGGAAESDNSGDNNGAVHVFTFSDGDWTQQAYVKASNSGSGDAFGTSVALSGDGDTLAVGAFGEDSFHDSVSEDGQGEDDDSGDDNGAAYIFTRNGAVWEQQAYVKASNGETLDQFGISLALSGDGQTLAVGANGEDGSGNLVESGAVYVFTQGNNNWAQQAYIKASNANMDDRFGTSVTLTNDGDTLAVGAHQEQSAATGIDGNQENNQADLAGAAYVFTRADGGGDWEQIAYVKAPNTEEGDNFGTSVVLSGNGSALAVGAPGEDSSASGIDGNSDNNNSPGSGAVYLY